MSSRSPVITGIGIISAAGNTQTEVRESLRAGRSGLGPLTLFPSSRYSGHLVGQIHQDFDRVALGIRGSRTDKLAWLAATEALRGALPDGDLGKPFCSRLDAAAVPRARRAVMLGSTVGGMLGTELFARQLLLNRRRRFGLLRFHECASTTDLVAELVGARGPCAMISTACSAGAQAIALAAELILADEADLVLAGGSDSLSRLTLNGFGSLLLLDRAGCRPFDAHRAGISLGEGAGMLVVEAEDSALARGARVLARLSGWGLSCDAHHATAPHPEGRGAFTAMQEALDRAQVVPSEIDFVCAHGTGTPDNDAMEAKALRRLFGEHPPPVASVMRFFGHTLAASGAMKAVLCVDALQTRHIPASLGCDEPDPTLGLVLNREYQAKELSHLLSNSFGFGGNNAALVFSRWQSPGRDLMPGAGLGSSSGFALKGTAPLPIGRAATLEQSLPRRALAIVGAGVVSPAGNSTPEVAASLNADPPPVSIFDISRILPSTNVAVYDCKDFNAERFIESTRLRRLSRFQQMAVVAARQSWLPGLAAGCDPERVCVSIGTGLGALNDTAAFVENLVLKDERAPRPALFTNSVHNALAAQVALELGLTGMNASSVQREICFEASVWQAAISLERGGAEFALVGAGDELNPYALAAGVRWGWWPAHRPGLIGSDDTATSSRPSPPGEGAAVFALSRDSAGVSALAWVSGIRIGRSPRIVEPEFEPDREAQWIEDTLVREGTPLVDVDVLLVGANGREPLDGAYREVAKALARRAGRAISCAAYKPWCGDYHSASAFGFLVAVGLVRGEISPARFALAGVSSPSFTGRCRKVVVYTLSPSGAKGMCCVCG